MPKFQDISWVPNLNEVGYPIKVEYETLIREEIEINRIIDKHFEKREALLDRIKELWNKKEIKKARNITKDFTL